jgi:hypothetical protein
MSHLMRVLIVATTIILLSPRIGHVEEPAANAIAGGVDPKLLKALDAPASIELVELSLRDAVDALKIAQGVEIQLDYKSLAEAGVSSDTPVTTSLTGISLRSALHLLLSPKDLEFVADKETLLITTRKAAEKWPVAACEGGKNPAKLVANAEVKIKKALDAPARFDFVDTPLSEVVNQVKLNYGIEVQLDWKALHDANVPADKPLTKSAKEVPLKIALRQILADQGLEFVVQPQYEVLLITDAKTAKQINSGK